MGRRVLRVVNTVVAVTASLIGSTYFFAGDGYGAEDPATATLHPSWWSALSLLAAIGAAVMLCWRHRWPVLVTAIAVVPAIVFSSDALAALISLAALAARRRDRLLWMGTAAVYTASTLAAWRDLGHRESVAGSFVHAETATGRVVAALAVAVVVTAIPLLVGIVRAVRGDLRRREAHERELRAQMTRQEERSRIAREMHDVLGHRLSLLSLHAGALEVSSGDGSPHAVEAAQTVRTAARQSLADLRQVIGVLRGNGDFSEGADPTTTGQPKLDDLPRLVAESRQAGLSVDLTMLLDSSGTAPAPLETAAYRIVQEALTNASRHAPGSPATVSLRGGPGSGLVIEVVNPLPREPPEAFPGSGTGLIGVAERVESLGGTVSSGPSAEGVFAVRVWLPWVRQ